MNLGNWSSFRQNVKSRSAVALIVTTSSTAVPRAPPSASRVLRGRRLY
jgi:hypothetical protein